MREAVRADTPEFVRIETEGAVLRIRLAAGPAASARETLEDLLACIQVAERALGARGSGPRSPVASASK